MCAEVPYEEMTNAGWKPDFNVQSIGAAVRYRGACPRCQHETVTTFPPLIPGEAIMREEGVDIFCKCGQGHTGRPDTAYGCGAYWNVSIEL